MSPWGWKPERTQGIWKYGASWMKAFTASAPFLSVLLLVLMFHMIGGTLTLSDGVLFDLPEPEPPISSGLPISDSVAGVPVALVMPVGHDTMVLLDDTRYLLSDLNSLSTLERGVSDIVKCSGRTTLLVLADRRIAGGELMKIAVSLRRGGMKRVLFAEKKTERLP